MVDATVHHLEIIEDERSLFKIETFCFEAGGVMNITVSDFSMRNPGPERTSGFIVLKTKTESEVQQMLEESVQDGTCLLDGSIFKRHDFLLDLSEHTESGASLESRWKHFHRQRVVAHGDEGIYTLVFVRCPSSLQDEKDTSSSKVGTSTVSFTLHVAFWNPGPNYLSACEAALPLLFSIFAGLFFIAIIAWVILLNNERTKVHHIHNLMAVLLVSKTLAMFFEAIRYHFIAIQGTAAAEGWSIAYYVFAFLKGLLLFTVILLIGSGWSLVKPYLNDREKRIVLVVLVLQVLDNVAMVVLEQMAPGSVTWYTWRDVLHLVDIICCCAILFPIVWSIRHLRQAATADGKAEHNIMKLTLFRQFYIMVVAYIYFTRIIVYLLAATMPYNLMWMRYLFTELATLSFYVITGYKFRPAEDNPYLPLSKEDSEDGPVDEFGLELGEDIELTAKDHTPPPAKTAPVKIAD
eukprot:CAMPEP_0185781226 /NCGR_PEP_ID=MMETSP1174-20130828/101613_1 /TAXON_ID=35687 /ORGANISM="Dictyocha speculum, Strain CCMP1381" /LENGTH=463 /DNA_ID=CAMNT_0028471113 /DNA_START=78 /DNA_END=1469 /DNA_ORIENTATION=+